MDVQSYVLLRGFLAITRKHVCHGTLGQHTKRHRVFARKRYTVTANARPPRNTVRMRVSAHCADAFLNVSISGFYRTGVRRLRPVRTQRTLCGIRIKSCGTLFVSAPLCGDSDLCDPDRNQSAVVGCFERTPLCEDGDLCDQKQITATIAALRVCCTMYGMGLLQQRVDHNQHNHTHTHQRHAAK